MIFALSMSGAGRELAWLPFLGVFVFGVASAGFYMLNEVIWANYFGRISLGTVRGIAHPVTALLSARVSWVIFDLQGSYQLAWVAPAIGLFFATVLMLLIQPPKPPSSAATALN